MKYQLRHVTTYTYDLPVGTSFGQAHLRPRGGQEQQVDYATVTVVPEATEMREHVDFYGNRASYFEVRTPHTELVVTAQSQVTVNRPHPLSVPTPALTWEQARQALAPEDPAREFTLSSPQVALSQSVREYAQSAIVPGTGFLEAIAELASRIHRDFEYRAGTTTVHSTLNEVLARRSGVCQDFAHLAVACLRTMGLAARYVSGYLETIAPPGQAKLQGADASHAWVSVLLPGFGWIDVDPTNDQFIDDRYIVLACGRDYQDVPPLKGVILTDAKHSTMRVNVDVTPVAATGQPS